MFLSFLAFAQEIKTHYIDSTGKLFVNPGAPVFLYMSTKPDGSGAVKLRSMQPEGNPMHWDGHGPHYLTHLNLYLGRKISFDLFADGRPPRTSPTFDSKQAFQKNSIIYLSGVGVFELAALDENSGVNKIYYSINGDEFILYSKLVNLNKEGEYSLKFYAIDNVGNKEDVGERTLIIDTTPPETELTIEGPRYNEVLSGRSKFSLKASDLVGVKQTYYSIDNGDVYPYKQVIPLSQLTEGEHTINWHSVDIVGNTESTKSFTFFLDNTPPMVFEEIVGNTYMVAGKEFSSGRSQLRVVAVDNKAGVKEIYYSINNNEYKLYEKPIYLSEITGAATIRSYAIDNVENKGISDAHGQQFSMPEVDITGPNIAYSFVGNRFSLRDTVWISPNTKVSITANDKGSGVNRIEYKLNDTQSQLYTEPFTVSQPGMHKANSSAWDNVENLNIISFHFGVDAQPPDIVITWSVKPHRYISEEGQKIPVFAADLKLFIAATDDIVGIDKIFASQNGAKERIVAEPLTGFKKGQNHTVTVRVTDKLGNQSTETVIFMVE